MCRVRCGLWVCRSVRVRSKLRLHAPANLASSPTQADSGGASEPGRAERRGEQRTLSILVQAEITPDARILFLFFELALIKKAKGHTEDTG